MSLPLFRYSIHFHFAVGAFVWCNFILYRDISGCLTQGHRQQNENVVNLLPGKRQWHSQHWNSHNAVLITFLISAQSFLPQTWPQPHSLSTAASVSDLICFSAVRYVYNLQSAWFLASRQGKENGVPFAVKLLDSTTYFFSHESAIIVCIVSSMIVCFVFTETVSCFRSMSPRLYHVSVPCHGDYVMFQFRVMETVSCFSSVSWSLYHVSVPCHGVRKKLTTPSLKFMGKKHRCREYM